MKTTRATVVRGVANVTLDEIPRTPSTTVSNTRSPESVHDVLSHAERATRWIHCLQPTASRSSVHRKLLAASAGR
ncbi:MAG TPA: hypothetical protein VIT91_20640 [Chthoniobacterales bacterium]